MHYILDTNENERKNEWMDGKHKNREKFPIVEDVEGCYQSYLPLIYLYVLTGLEDDDGCVLASPTTK